MGVHARGGAGIDPATHAKAEREPRLWYGHGAGTVRAASSLASDLARLAARQGDDASALLVEAAQCENDVLVGLAEIPARVQRLGESVRLQAKIAGTMEGVVTRMARAQVRSWEVNRQ